MSELNIKRIMNLARYGLGESNDYREETAEQEEYGETHVTGEPKTDNRQVNNHGDNPMIDHSKLAEGLSTRVQSVLGIMFSDVASSIVTGDYQAAPGGVTIGDEFVPVDEIIDFFDQAGIEYTGDIGQAISKFIRILDQYEADFEDDGEEHGKLNEFRDGPLKKRFSHTVDSLGEVTVHDAEAGTSVHLTGEDALELLGELELHGKSEEMIQQILSQYQHVMEQQIDEYGQPSNNPDADEFNFFGAHSLDELKSLDDDFASMVGKLKKMHERAKAQHDFGGMFAAETFIEEIGKLKDYVTEYISKADQ